MYDTIRIRDGKVFVEVVLGIITRPARRRLAWLADVDPARVVEGWPARWKYQGAYSSVGPTGLPVTFLLVGGPGGNAEIDEEIPVECPKVRKGTKTKWDGSFGELGAWMKLTAKGWVAIEEKVAR